MKELVVLGFDSRELAEEARSRGAELDREGALQLDGAALAYRREDGRVELVQPMRLVPAGAASGAAVGGVLGLLLVEPVVFAAVGAAVGAVGAELSALGLNQWFLRQVGETLEPGRAAYSLSSATPATRAGNPSAAAPRPSGAAHHPRRCGRATPPRRLHRSRSPVGLHTAVPTGWRGVTPLGPGCCSISHQPAGFRARWSPVGRWPSATAQ
jgi:uncharacterized membrane protein